MKFPSLGVVIGRFQVDALHRGHLELLKAVNSRHERMLVLIGDRISPATATNPLPYAFRERMVRDAFPNAVVLPLLDCPSNEEWSERVDAAVKVVAANGDVVLYSGRDGFLPCYSGRYKTEQLDFGVDALTATQVREDIVRFPSHNSEFRAGMIYALNTLHHRTFHTVDIAMLRWSRDVLEVLLAQKPNETRWQFPGGFVDAGETFAKAARREMMEETGLTCEHRMEFVRDYFIDDWRVRRQKGVDHKTVLMRTWYGWGRPTAGDDVAKVEWFDLYYVVKNLEELIVPHHRELVEDLEVEMTAECEKRQKKVVAAQFNDEPFVTITEKA